MRPGVAWLASVASLPLFGLWVPFARPFGRLPVGARIALAGGVGAFVLSTLMTLFAVAGIPWGPVPLCAGAVVASAMIGYRLSKEPPLTLAASQRWSPAAVAGVLVSAGGVAVAVLSVLGAAATSGDLFLFWGPKAEAFARAATIDAAFLRDPTLEYLHASYPPLVTNVFSFASMIASRISWGAATATFPLMLAALAVSLPGILRLSLSRSTSNATACVVVCGIGLLGTETDIAGNAEMPLLFFETLSMALLVSPAARERSAQVLAGLLLGGAAATKVEGLPFVIAAALVFVLLRREVPQRGRVLFRLLAPAAIAVSAWFAFGAKAGLFRGYRGYGDVLSIYPGTLAVAVPAIAQSLWLIGYGLPFLVPAALLILRPRPWKPATLPLATAAALVAFLVLTYIHVPHPEKWIDWSAARVFSPLIPLVALSAAAAARAEVGGPTTRPQRSTRD